jgi:hypothetical protein
VGEIGEWPALPDTLPIDEIKSLSGALHHPALAEDFGDSADARVLRN